MRGKGVDRKIALLRYGITPAYAGKSPGLDFGLQRTGDHPRVCGEKTGTELYNRAKNGSPPRMRGKACGQSDRQPVIRITPAYAGKSHQRRLHIGQPGDHPRVCGEKHDRRVKVFSSKGSPPRMRGKAPAGQQMQVVMRITPAYAGKSPQTLFESRNHLGSPPRMRGKGSRCRTLQR